MGTNTDGEAALKSLKILLELSERKNITFRSWRSRQRSFLFLKRNNKQKKPCYSW